MFSQFIFAIKTQFRHPKNPYGALLALYGIRMASMHGKDLLPITDTINHLAKKTKVRNGLCVPSVVSLWHFGIMKMTSP